jgi:hypothetical protein
MLRSLHVLAALIMCSALRADCPLQGAQPVQEKALAYRAFSNRCEGFYESKVSSSGQIELVSLARGAFPDSLRAPLTLTISNASKRAVTLHARPVRRAVYYQMVAQLAPQQTFSWPTTDVLARTTIAGKYLGIVGQVTADDRRIFVPVSINRATTAPVAVFRAGRPLAGVKWRLKTVRGGQCGDPAAWQTTAMTEDEGRIIRVNLPEQTGYCVEVLGRDGAQPVSGTYQVESDR